MKDHRNKTQLLLWIKEVKREDLLSPFTHSTYQGILLYSDFSQEQQFLNYVPPEFKKFIDSTGSEWVQNKVLAEWEKEKELDDA